MDSHLIQRGRELHARGQMGGGDSQSRMRRHRYRAVQRLHAHSPLDLTEQWMAQPRTSYTYELQVVPVTTLSRRRSYRAALTQSHYTLDGGDDYTGAPAPSLRFAYSLLPLGVTYTRVYPSLFLLLVEAVSVTGGVYVLALLTDNALDWLKIAFKIRTEKKLT